jgi:Na+-transporting NADH:ubiquinone oxidoreductase subunit B
MSVPWYHHFGIGSALFAMVFMATDPVTAAQTNLGKLWYGFLIGVFGMMIRVMNPAYPEGWMLAILIMNVFAPLVDHFVIEGNISKRMKRAKQYAK